MECYGGAPSSEREHGDRQIAKPVARFRHNHVTRKHPPIQSLRDTVLFRNSPPSSQESPIPLTLGPRAKNQSPALCIADPVPSALLPEYLNRGCLAFFAVDGGMRVGRSIDRFFHSGLGPPPPPRYIRPLTTNSYYKSNPTMCLHGGWHCHVHALDYAITRVRENAVEAPRAW